MKNLIVALMIVFGMASLSFGGDCANGDVSAMNGNGSAVHGRAAVFREQVQLALAHDALALWLLPEMHGESERGDGGGSSVSTPQTCAGIRCAWLRGIVSERGTRRGCSRVQACSLI